MEVTLRPLVKLLLNVIAKRLTVLSWSMSTKTKVSVGLCESVANEKKLV
jgi:hypothetical protein